MSLTETQKTIMSTTRGDLNRLTIVGVALLRGTACLAELNAMAAMAKPGKTKHLPAEVRGVLAYQSTLDRFAGLLKAADVDDILVPTAYRIHDATNPVDACLEATAFDKVTLGKAALVKDHGLLMFARGIFIQLKAKYGDRLNAERTVKLDGGAKVLERTKAEKAKAAFARLSESEKAALIAEVTGIAPAQEPEILSAEAAQTLQA
jgi:hypothetical protein